VALRSETSRNGGTTEADEEQELTVFSICQRIVVSLLLLLYDQNIIDLNQHQIDHQSLEKERLRAEYKPYSLLWMFTLIAQYPDGTPARGWTNCNEVWCKYDEVEQCARNLPFKTDGRGAAIFNPPGSWFIDEDASTLTCYTTAGLRSGKLSFMPYDGGVFYITIPGQPE